MIERIAEVVGESDGRWQLRPISAACSGCDSGCGGRCRLFLGSSTGRISVPVPLHPDLRPGQQVALRIEEDALGRAAWRGYGLALLGLLVGALLGAGLAGRLFPASWRDASTLVGLLAGTFLAAFLSKRHVTAASLHPLDAATPGKPMSHSSKSEPA